MSQQAPQSLHTAPAGCVYPGNCDGYHPPEICLPHSAGPITGQGELGDEGRGWTRTLQQTQEAWSLHLN